MRVFFFGGCHGATFHQIFNRFCLDEEFQSKAVLNYKLIEERRPFPFEELEKDYDALVMNPILHHEEYNTDRLVEFCSGRGIRVISYPWLQWNGYFPQIARGAFGFGYPAILAAADTTSSVAQLRRWVEEKYLSACDIRSSFDATTEHLISYEEEGRCTIRISDVVLSKYRAVRLFNSPDHPSNYILRFVAGQIAAQLGIELDASLQSYSEEFQAAEVTPILPRVRDVLGLEFSGTDYRLEEKWGCRSFSFAEWVRLYKVAKPNQIMLWAHYDAEVEICGNRKVFVPEKSFVLAESRDGEANSAFFLVDGPADLMRMIGRGGEFTLPEPVWHRIRV